MKKKYKIAMAAITAAGLIGITGCGGAQDVLVQINANTDTSVQASIHEDSNGKDDSNNTNPNTTSGSSDIDLTQFPTDKGTLLKAAINGMSNIFIVVDDKIVFAGDINDIVSDCGLSLNDPEYATAVAYDRGVLLTYIYSEECYSLYALDPINKQNSLIEKSKNHTTFSMSGDKLYARTSSYDSATGNISFTENYYTRVNDTLEYTVCDALEPDFMNYIESFDQYFLPVSIETSTMVTLSETIDSVGYVIAQIKDTYHKVYPDMHSEYLLPRNNSYPIWTYDANYVVIPHTGETKGNYIEIIDSSNHTSSIVIDRMDHYIGYKNGCIYYSVTEYDDYRKSYNTYLYNIWDDETVKIFSSDHYAGMTNHYIPGSSSSVIIDNIFYTLACNGKTTDWYAITSSEDGYNTTDTDVNVISYPWLEFGTLDYVYTEDYCPYCGIINYTYYSETFTASDDIACGSKITDKMTELENERTNMPYAHNVTRNECRTDHTGYDNISPFATNAEFQFEEIKILSSHYLALYSYGYVNAGGAHGYSVDNQYVFDLNTGDYIEFKNLYTGTEEQLKAVVASAAKADCQNEIDEYGYSHCYNDEPDNVYDSAYAVTSIDTIIGNFEEDGFHVFFEPYSVGPYASGYISVVIPYEDLGITAF